VVRPEDREEGAALVDPGAHAARVLVEAHADSLAEVRVEPGVADDETAGEGAVAAVLDALDPDGFVEAMAGVVARDERYADRIRADVDAGRTDPDETVVVMGGAHTLADRPRDRGFDPAVDPGREEAMSRGERAMWAVRRRTSAAVVGAVEAARERVGGLLGRDDGESGAARSETAAADEGRLVETVGDAPDDPERGAEHTADESEAGERGEPAGVSRRPRPDPPATKRAGE
jgi:hypothetical protein